jgi:Fe-S cluster biogenesis protein NfuA/nitrite reductase/ring-hydroxylating ferredoxin subunit
MSSVAEQQAPRGRAGQGPRRLDEIESLPDPAARDVATGGVQALLELYGEGLGRIVEVVAEHAEAPELARAFAEDELISHLLLLHGLHPSGLEDRVREALGEVRPYLESHGGNVELVGIEGTAVKLRLQGSCSGCPSSTMTLKLAIENAIRKAAPEVEQVLAEEPAAAPTGLLQIEVAPAALDASARDPIPRPTPGPTPLDSTWAMAGGLPELASGGTVVKPIGGTPLLFLRIGGQAYAYHPHCPACEQSLEGASIERIELICPGCGNRYDALRAGRGVDLPQLHLEPVPLLEDEDVLVRVALPVLA